MLEVAALDVCLEWTVLCTRRHSVVAPAGDAASKIAALNITAGTNCAADFRLKTDRRRFPKSATCLCRLWYSDSPSLGIANETAGIDRALRAPAALDVLQNRKIGP